MVENGVMGNMRTLFPALSPMLWTSIATGKRPFKHGIYGFTEPGPSGNSIQPMTNVSRRCKAIWNILNQHDLQSVVVGWWPSHPAEPINGVMVSDYFHKAPKKPGDAWPLNRRCVHPQERLAELGQYRVHPLELVPEDILPFVPEGADIDQKTDGRLASIMKVTAECTTVHTAATHLLENDPWDFAAIYYDAIDHYSHGFMRYRAPQQSHISDHDFRIYQHVVSMGYIYHDMMLKRLLELAGEDTAVIVMSDHGFHPDHLRPVNLPAEPAGPAMEHRDYGIFVAMGPGIKKDHIIHGANLLDVTPTILTLYGLPVAEDMDGRPLLDIFEQEPEVRTIPSWEEVPGNDGQHPEDMVIDPEEAREVLEQLVALGYIERPHDDSRKAIQQCQRELDYNLARSWMDAGIYGEAIPLLLDLYQENPLEFRFGIQLANCLRVMSRHSDLKRLIEDLNARWRMAAVVARRKIREVATVARERRDHWKRLKAMDEQNDDPDLPQLARVTAEGKPILFEENEMHTIRKLRAIARGNPQTLDFLAATVAMSEGNFEEALQYMDKARLKQAQNPAFEFHLGNVYMELDRLQDAEEAFLRGLQLDEFHPNCLMGMCRCYLEMGRVNKALEYGQRAIGLKYHFPPGHFFLGMARQRAGDVEGAIESLHVALEQNPNFVEAHETLAAIYGRSALDEELARQHKAAARELASDNETAAEQAEPLEFRSYSADELDTQLPKILDDQNSETFIRCLSQAKLSGVEEQPDGIAETPEVILVSGLPRSGTSMMMQMLKAGGMPLFTDNVRIADESNPRGYFEADAVKRLTSHNNWLAECDGQVLKVVAPLVPYLPQNVNYRVIFMRRPMNEVIGSQTDMLQRLGEAGGNIEDDKLARVFAQQAYFAITLLTLHQNPVLRLSYDDVVEDPERAARQIASFLDRDLDVPAMVAAVDPDLSRQKQKKMAEK
jgi:predicted AlkP superfamily phosphohydrolase/phosphomutase/tetratricopeptide (TPR) repeat protein